MATPEDVNHMASLLLALTQPDNEAIRQAETALKPILKDARSIPALLEVLKGRGVQPNAVRHVAAILLRKRIGGHYAAFDSRTKINFKSEVLQVLANEPERAVRGGVVGVAAAVSELESGEGWPELWQFIAAAAHDPHPDARELAFWLLQEMTDTIGANLKSQFQNMATSLFEPSLKDSESRVQKASVKALGQLISFLTGDPEVEIFVALLPDVLGVAQSEQADEELVTTVLDVLYDLAYSSSPSVTAQLKAIVGFALHCMESKEMDMGARDSAALVISTIAEAKPRSFGRDKESVAAVLDTLFSLIENSSESAAGALLESNPAWKEDMGAISPEDYENDDEDGPTETSIAQSTLDMMACELPKKYIYQPSVSRCIALLKSPDPSKRKSGISGLGVIAEGCSAPMREHLPDVMPFIFSAAGDADSRVRECSCFALGQIAEHCQPEILGYSSQVLPIIFALLDDTTVSVQATSCYVLEMFCERLEPDAVRPLLDPLVRKLAAMLESSTKRSVQEMAVAALAATSVAAEEEFTPYLGGVAALMTKLMSLQEERLYSLRGRALECMGHMAIAVGKQTFRPYFTGTMQCACDGLATESTDLHEFAYAVFSNLAKVMGEEFAPVLPDLVPHLVKVIGANEGTMEKNDEDDQDDDGFVNLEPSNLQEDKTEEGFVLHVRTALLEAKKAAITAIGEMAAHTGSAFVPHLEEVMEVLHDAGTNHWHPLIKCEVAEALPSMVMPSLAAYHGGEIPWEKGDVSGSSPMSQHTAAITSAVLGELIFLMREDDKDTVGKACEGVQAVIEMVGPHALIPVASECLKNTHELLMQKAPCQSSDESPSNDHNEIDHDVFMNSVCDLLGSFARVMGSHFKQYLKEFLPAVCAYCDRSRPPSDRAMAVGCLSELAQELESTISEYWSNVFKVAILEGLADPDDNVKRNAAFCTGVCCESLGDEVTPDYKPLLQAVSKVLDLDPSNGESSAAAVDNAASAISRMIMASPDHVPMDKYLPRLFSALPLKTDMTENETVYTCLLGLLQLDQPAVTANKEELRRILTEATSDTSKVADEIQEKLRLAVQSLKS